MNFGSFMLLVLVTGLEPVSDKGLEPESSASANSATRALKGNRLSDAPVTVAIAGALLDLGEPVFVGPEPAAEAQEDCCPNYAEGGSEHDGGNADGNDATL